MAWPLWHHLEIALTSACIAAEHSDSNAGCLLHARVWELHTSFPLLSGFVGVGGVGIGVFIPEHDLIHDLAKVKYPFAQDITQIAPVM